MSELSERIAEYRLSSQQCAVLSAGWQQPEFSMAALIDGPAKGFTLETLRRVIADKVQRHEVLRTRYRAVPGMRLPLQSVVEDLPAAWLMADAGVDDEHLIAAARSLLDPVRGSAVGVAVSLADERVRLVFAVSKLNLDAHGIQALADICATADSREVLQNLDYVAWQQELFDTDLGKEGARYWSLCAQEMPEVASLPFESRRAGASTASHVFELGAALSEAIQVVARRIEVTAEQMLLALWAAFLARLAQTDRLAIEWHCAVRAEELQGALGRYVTPLPLALRLDPQTSASTLVAAVTERLQSAASWHECFDATAHLDALTRRGRSRSGIEFEYVQQRQLSGGWCCRRIDTPPGDARLRCQVLEAGSAFSLQLHSHGVFATATLDIWVRQFATLLASFAEQPDTTWMQLNVISPAERDALLRLGRVGQIAPPANTLLHELFEQQARRCPEACAVVCGDERLTYAELNARADALAAHLQRLGTGPDRLIGIHIGRSAHAITAMLAVLKAGAAYVPIDPAYPADRIDYVLQDAAISILIASSGDRSRLSGLVPAFVCIDECVPEQGVLRRAPPSPSNLAYAIYTSGSTGQPKGVMVSHANAVASTRARFAFYPDPVSSYLLLSSFSFDSSVAGIFWTLAQGGTLYLPTQEQHQDPIQIAGLLTTGAISHVLALPSFYKQIIAAIEGATSLRCAIVAGEACHAEVVDLHRRQLPRAALVNEYGPTEGTVWSHAHAVAEAGDERIPIGRPVDSMTSVVLDAALELCPLGVAGELYLGGSGITRGYLNRGGLTAQRYVADSFVPRQRLYRTGDLVRYRPDGELEYLGRIDHQVKIRGFRVELGEIEAQLRALQGVEDAVAVANEGPGGLRLVAYVTSPALDVSALREQLAQALPPYMVPSVIVLLERLPLMPNGKVDRNALPDPDLGQRREYEAPRDDVEETFCSVWQDVLGVARVGRNDNLFELGGDSIVGLQIVARLRKAGWKLTPKQLFEGQTVARVVTLAQRIEEQTRDHQATATGAVPLLPIQAEFFQMAMERRHRWNQAVLLHPRQALDPRALQRALAAVVTQHDSLRLRYRRDAEGDWQQAYEPVPEEQLQDLLWLRQARDPEQIEALCDSAQDSLDLTQGSLLRALAIEVADGSWRLLLVIHHLVVDGVSWRVLLEDLQAGYEQSLAQRDIVLPEKTASYQDWAVALRDYAEHHGEEVTYWQTLMEVPSTLPCANPRGTNIVADQRTVQIKFDQARTEALLKDAPAAYRTQINDLLLTALGRALCAWSGHDRILIDAEGHGREDLAEDINLSRTVGWFTSVHPVVLDPLGGLGAALKRVKETLRQVPNRGLGYGVLKHLGNVEQRAILSVLPRAQVLFNYLGQFDGSFGGSALWRPAQERAGACLDPTAQQSHELTINGRIYDGELTFVVHYSAARHEPAAVEACVEQFRLELQALIAHCTAGVREATPSDFPLAALTQPQLDQFPIALARVDDLYPLTPMQAGMLFHSVYDPSGTAYINQLCVTIEGLDPARFKQAWQAVINAHDVLRTGFLQTDSPLQWVAKSVAVSFTEGDLSDDGEHSRELEELARAELTRPFDLAEPPLMRWMLVRLPGGRQRFIWTHHHLLLDGWSTSQLMSEVLARYDSGAPQFKGGRYRDFIAWLGARDARASTQYWADRMAMLDAPSLLAAALPKAGGAGEYRKVEVALTSHQTAGLIAAAARERVTVNTLVQGAWALLLSRCLRQPVVCFGATVAGRPAELAGVEQALGLFINTLPVCASVRSDVRLGDWLRELQTQNLLSREHEHVPLYEIQRTVEHAGQGLFDTLLVFENYPVDQLLRQVQPGGLAFQDFSNREETNYPLAVEISQSEVLTLCFEYSTGQVAARSVDTLSTAMLTLLQSFTDATDARLGELQLLTDEHSVQIARWGRNLTRHPNTDPVHRLIERQAERTPAAPALICGAQELSYAELNRQANRLAHRLLRLGVRPEVKVGIAVERSIEMAVALMAILKAGGAYVPLDTEYPAERLAYMVEDSGIALLLTQSHLQARVSGVDSIEVLTLDTLDLANGHEHDPRVELHGENLAYVIYTSGSTGRPKGIEITHAALAEHSQVAVGYFGLTRADRMLQFSTINFDGFVEQFFPPLLAGAAVVLRGPTLWDSETFYRELLDKRISIADLPTSYWHLLAHDFARQGPRDYGVLRQVQATGEAMPPEGIERWRDARLSHVKLLNTYGPTETVVTATALDCAAYVTGEQALPSQIPIGHSLAGRHAYVLDADLNLAPPGVAGELYLGGALLARGYHQRAGLSAERFIADPLDAAGGRLCRTGDLARWNQQRQLEYLGRVDHQVKLRGFRIELEEIETQLRAQRGVREAVVVARKEDAGTRLVGYVASEDRTMQAEALMRALGEVLPEYMVPSAILVLDRLPKNASGKLDRQALPEPQTTGDAIHEAPRGEVEQTLAQIWAEVLGIERVGRHDRFFALGGDSILSLKVVARARKCDLELTPRDVFDHHRLCDLAASVTHSSTPAAVISPLAAADRNLPQPLSFAQARQWFLWQLDPHSTAYHISSALRLEGELNEVALRDSFDALVARHESLRTSFIAADDGQAMQVVRPLGEPALVVIDLSEVSVATRSVRVEQEAARFTDEPFDLTRGPLLRVGLMRIAAGEHLLVVVMHHIVSDDWSMQLLVDELVSQYRARVRGEEPALAPLPLQYVDYAVWQRDWLAAGERDRQLAYWKSQLGEKHPVLQLPTDHPRRADGRYRAGRRSVQLSTQLARGLMCRAKVESATLFTVLLTGLQVLLHRYSGQPDIRVGVPIANRHRVEAGAVVGFFINTQVLRAVMHGRSSLQHVLEEMKAAALGAQSYQDLPFEQLVEVLQPGRRLGVNPLFQVMFNHLRQDYRALQQLPNLRLQHYELAERGVQFELTVDSSQAPDGSVDVSFTYARELFEAATIQRMLDHYVAVLRALAEQPEQAVGEIPLFSEPERKQLEVWSVNEQRYDDAAPIHRLIERQVQQTPDAPALLFGEQVLSYAELNRRANRLAHRLITLGVRPERIVGIEIPRCVEMVVALLAILKAGGAYLPLDSEYPAGRLEYMVEDSGIDLLLTHGDVRDRVPAADGLQALELDTLDVSSEPEHDPAVELHGDNLAYVIYTSGSTGRPKGAANKHRSLYNRLRWMQQAYPLDATDTVLQKTPFSFDVSVWEFFWPLMVGAQLAVANPDDHRNPARLVELIQRYRVTALHFVPSMLQAFLAHEGIETCASLRHVVCSGEALSAEAQNDVFKRLPSTALHNLYGPTEAAIDVTHWTCRGDGRTQVPIGQPIASTKTYVLDGDLRQVPRGVTGELYLGGVGLARGYWQRRGLTAERFVTDPFDDHGGRLYRTGDLARWNAHGQLEYLGRVDHQIKIRGFRIELGEVEAQLLAQPEIREAVVVARGSQLVGYISLLSERFIDPSQLRARLAAALPEYMVTSAIMVLPTLPLNANGKVDRQALPDFASEVVYEAPQGDVEQTLASIWAEVLELDVDRIGRHDHFFELGGHSLAALQVLAQTQRRLALQLPLKQLFERPVLQDYSAALSAERRQAISREGADLDRMSALLEALEDG